MLTFLFIVISSLIISSKCALCEVKFTLFKRSLFDLFGGNADSLIVK